MRIGTLIDERPIGITRVWVRKNSWSVPAAIPNGACFSSIAADASGTAVESPIWTRRKPAAASAITGVPLRIGTRTGLSLSTCRHSFHYPTRDEDDRRGLQPGDARGGDRNRGLHPPGRLSAAYRGSRVSLALLRLAGAPGAGRGRDGRADGPPVVAGSSAAGHAAGASRPALRARPCHPVRVAGQIPHGGPRPRIRATSGGLLVGRTLVSASDDAMGATALPPSHCPVRVDAS